MHRRFLPRTVVVLGLVSFFNDIASEMITPVLPLFLTATLGAGPAVVGLIEGVAEATASLLKLAAGRWVDRHGRHKALVLGGYGVSNAARPLIGLATGWGAVLLFRFLDRVGKGIRTAPRDALIAAAVEPGSRGRAFGFHRAMDHAGATVGPLAAFVLLQAGVGLRDVFLLSVIPGVVLMALLWRGIPADRPVAAPAPLPRLAWRALDRRLRALVVAAGGLALAAAPDAFLVLWASARGVELAWVPLLWAVAHGVRSLLAGVGGELSDRRGRLPVVLIGWGARVAMLVALALAPVSLVGAWALFLAYAATTAFTEGAERALIGDAAAEGEKATAFGLYHMLAGLLALPGALLFGVLWERLGMAVAFLVSAALTTLAAGTLLALSRR
ncbi:MAG: MFS transporter [Rhodothermaceae bacterium]|nr:MAG: MFS transporter [Rhodothermaceae bacterium]